MIKTDTGSDTQNRTRPTRGRVLDVGTRLPAHGHDHR